MAKDGESPNSLLNDSGNFWQQEAPGPFGSLIDLAFKLKNAQFRLLQKFGDKPERYSESSSCLIFQSSTGVYRKYKDRQHGISSQGHLLSKSSRSTLQDLSDNYAVDSSCNMSSAFKRPLLPEPNKPLKFGMHFENISEKKRLPRKRKSKLFNTAPKHAGTMDLLSKQHSPESPTTRKSRRLQRYHEDPKRMHNCPLCLYQTDSRFHLRRHQSSVHDADKAYYCYICKKEFSRSERVKSHFLNIHPEATYYSKMTRKDTIMSEGENDLDMEVEEVIDDSCDAGTPSSIAFESVQSAVVANNSTAKKSWERYCHIARQPLINQEIFNCQLCCFSGGDIWLMKKHYLDVHLGVTAYICRICRYSSSCVTRLISHMLGHGELICYHCSYSTTEVKLFEKHLKECSQLVRCSLCAMSFVEKDQLQSHTIEVHQSMLFCCDQCSFTSNSYAELSIHEGMHAISNPSLVQEIESDDEMLLGPYRSRSDISNASLPNRLLKQQLQGNAGTSVDDAVVITNDGDDVTDKTPNPSSGASKDISSVAAGTTIPLSSRIYECLVPNCGFKAFWKKSLELHTENYHSISFEHFPGDRSLGPCDGWPPTVVDCPSSGFFPCPFCPNYRTFKYRKSFEKHLGQHGLDHKKYPYLLSGLNRKGEFLNSAVVGIQ